MSGNKISNKFNKDEQILIGVLHDHDILSVNQNGMGSVNPNQVNLFIGLYESFAKDSSEKKAIDMLRDPNKATQFVQKLRTNKIFEEEIIKADLANIQNENLKSLSAAFNKDEKILIGILHDNNMLNVDQNGMGKIALNKDLCIGLYRSFAENSPEKNAMDILGDNNKATQFVEKLESNKVFEEKVKKSKTVEFTQFILEQGNSPTATQNLAVDKIEIKKADLDNIQDKNLKSLMDTITQSSKALKDHESSISSKKSNNNEFNLIPLKKPTPILDDCFTAAPMVLNFPKQDR